MGYTFVRMEQMGTKLFSIEHMAESDWPAVRDIYVQGINSGNATFEKSAPDWASWDASHLRICRLVARAEEGVDGWAALSPVSNRCVYGGVAEVSVYVALQAQGQGIGTKLLASLVDASERQGIWTLQAGIFLENVPSVELHKHHGFRIVGTREKLGSMDGRWRDVLLMERRSKVTGI
jgi:phosphinothricin acetyltransferase